MSMITENTVVIKPDAEERVMNDLADYGCSGINKVWSNDKMIVILFDNNGDNPWDIQGTANTQADWEDILAIETNYGDEDDDGCLYYTQVNTEEYGMSPYDGELLDWLHDQLTEREYNKVKKLIAYTI